MSSTTQNLVLVLVSLLCFTSCLSENRWHTCEDTEHDCDNPSVIVPLLEDLDLYKISKVNADFQWDSGTNIACLEQQISIIESIQDVALLANGSLLHLPTYSILDFNNYCLKKSCLQDIPVFEKVDLCFERPILPMCINSSGNSSEMDATLNIGKYSVYQQLPVVPTEVKCLSDDLPVNITLSEDLSGIRLSIKGNELILVHPRSVLEPINYIRSDNFCLSKSEDSSRTEASYCLPNHLDLHLEKCKDVHCVRKCCPAGYIYDIDSFQCVPAVESDRWYPKYYHPSDPSTLYTGDTKVTMMYGLPLCLDFFPVGPGFSPPETVKLLVNGTLLIEDDAISRESHLYCIDNFQESTSLRPMEGAFSCFAPETSQSSECPHFQQLVYPILLLISSGFILATLLVYGFLPELHCKTQNKCLLSSLIALFVAYLCLSTMQLASNKLSMGLCVSTGLLTQYSVLASFFWLNVMSFDIWRTLRSMSPRMGSSHSSRNRFMLYCLYGWGCPLLISLATIAMQFLPEKNSGLIQPGFGETSCLFTMKDDSVRWIYMYGFICVILFVNTCFFVHLAIILRKAQELSENTLGKRNQQKKWAKLYFKLFLIMGISWILEAASWVEGTCVIWIATDINNSLRGFFIFVVLVCKQDILDKIRHKGRTSLSQVTSSLHSSFLNRSSTKRSNKVSVDVTGSSRNEQTSFVRNSTEQHVV